VTQPTPRSILCVPGSSERMLHKAFSSPADQVVIDLEDAVLPADKAKARGLAVEFLRTHDAAVRINGSGTPWMEDDLRAVGSLASSIVMPKVESAADIDGDRVQALIESARGLLAAEEIAVAPGVVGLIIGYADLGASLGRRDCSPEQWVPAQERVLWAARAAGIAAIDGPHLGVRVDDAFTTAVRRAAAAGFHGKWVIHPDQLDTVNQVLSPSADEVDWARRVLAALQGEGAVQLDGQMLDEAIAAGARRVLARAKVAS
jgi:citrate lyase beta subunit